MDGIGTGLEIRTTERNKRDGTREAFPYGLEGSENKLFFFSSAASSAMHLQGGYRDCAHYYAEPGCTSFNHPAKVDCMIDPGAIFGIDHLSLKNIFITSRHSLAIYALDRLTTFLPLFNVYTLKSYPIPSFK